MSVEQAIDDNEPLEVIKSLVEKSSTITEDTLTEATKENRLDIIKYILEDVPINIYEKEEEDYKTVLIDASIYGYLDIVKYVIKKRKIYINCYDENNNYNEDYYTPLIWASLEGNLNIVKYLYKKGAKMRHKKSSSTALTEAVLNGRKKIVEFFIKNGEDINQLVHGDTSLPMLASEFDSKKSTQMIKFLLKNGANPFFKNKEGWNLLMYCSQNINQIKIVKHLLDIGVNVYDETTDGDTALSNAINNENTQITSLLIKHITHLQKTLYHRLAKSLSSKLESISLSILLEKMISQGKHCHSNFPSKNNIITETVSPIIKAHKIQYSLHLQYHHQYELLTLLKEQQ